MLSVMPVVKPQDQVAALNAVAPNAAFHQLTLDLLAADEAEQRQAYLAAVGAVALSDAPVTKRLDDLADKLDALLHRGGNARPMPPALGSIDAAVRAAVREEVQMETRAALADHRAATTAAEDTKLLPLAQAAPMLGLTTKALRSRIERGSVPSAVRVGGRWHVAVGPGTSR